MDYLIVIISVILLFIGFRYYKSYIEFNKLSKSIDIRLLKAKNTSDLKPIWFDIIKLHNLIVTKKQSGVVHKLVSRIDDINSYYYDRENND